MKKHYLLVKGFLVVFFLCFFIIQVNAQNNSTITGFVFGPGRNPVPQIPVELLNEVNSVLQRTKTDGSGRFFFSRLSQGRFTIKVLPLGTNYEEKSEEVEIYGVGIRGRALGDTVQKDFYLKNRKDNETRPIIGVLFVQDIPQDAQKLYTKAISEVDNNNTSGAVSNLEAAIKIFPTYYLALEKLGIIYTSQKNLESAREMFHRAVIVNARSFNSWYGLSYVNYYLNQSTEAIEAAEKAISLNPTSVNAFLFLGLAQRQNKQYENAEKSLKQANKLSEGKSADVHWNLALLYAHNLKRFKDAADELELYLKYNSNSGSEESIKKLIKKLREESKMSN